MELFPEIEVAASPAVPNPPVGPSLTEQQEWRLTTLLKALVGAAVVSESAYRLEQQTVDIHNAFQPRNTWQDWLTGTIATIMLRINRCERIERKLRDLASYRAIRFWEEDQKLAVETVALKLGKEPGKTVAKLRETPAGIDWLLSRWQILAKVEPDAWTDDQRELAHRLAGGDPTVDPAVAGFAHGRIDELTSFRARVVEADTIIRGLVEADLLDDRVPDLAKLRRYNRSLHRQMKWYVDQFHVEHPDRWDDPRRRPASEAPEVPEYRPMNKDQFEGRPTFAPPTGPAKSVDSATPLSVAPENGETKPFAAVSTSAECETKPFAVVSTPEKCETKPFAAVALTAGVAPSVPNSENGPRAVVHDYATERGRHHSRPLRAGERSREYGRRLRAARRQTNLDLITSL